MTGPTLRRYWVSGELDGSGSIGRIVEPVRIREPEEKRSEVSSKGGRGLLVNEGDINGTVNSIWNSIRTGSSVCGPMSSPSQFLFSVLTLIPFCVANGSRRKEVMSLR